MVSERTVDDKIERLEPGINDDRPELKKISQNLQMPDMALHFALLLLRALAKPRALVAYEMGVSYNCQPTWLEGPDQYY
jgi:hypothetical protein